MAQEEILTVENQEFGPNKKKFRDNFAAAYPDIDMNDEEAYFGVLNDRNDQYDKDKERLDYLEGAQRSFGEALDKDPGLAELFLEMTKPNGKPVEFLIERYPKEFSDLVNDPDNDEYRKALADRLTADFAEAKNLEQMEDEAEQNIGPSLDALAKVAEERGLSDDQVTDAFTKFAEFAKDLQVAKVSEDMWRVFIDGLNHSADVEQARIEGETAGRNSRISEKLRQQQPSALNMGAGGGSVAQPPKKASGIDDMSRSVWD